MEMLIQSGPISSVDGLIQSSNARSCNGPIGAKPMLLLCKPIGSLALSEDITGDPLKILLSS